MLRTIYFFFLDPNPTYKKREHVKNKNRNLSRCNILLECAQERVLFFLGLVLSVSELGRCVDPLEIDLLE